MTNAAQEGMVASLAGSRGGSGPLAVFRLVGAHPRPPGGLQAPLRAGEGCPLVGNRPPRRELQRTGEKHPGLSMDFATMVCEPGRKPGFDRVGLLLQLAQILDVYLGIQKFHGFSRDFGAEVCRFRTNFARFRRRGRG